MLRLVITTATALGLALGAAGSAQAADAKQVFDFYCAQCHGVNGDGKGINVTKDFATDPRNFTIAADMEKRSDDDIRVVIKDGGPAISPGVQPCLRPKWTGCWPTSASCAIARPNKARGLNEIPEQKVSR
jgi:cytochrome c oxidase cbb3-type subunit III